MVDFLLARYPIIAPAKESPAPVGSTTFSNENPILGTCAGLIMMSRSVNDNRVKSLNILDIEVDRNAYGRQVNSFTDKLSINIVKIFRNEENSFQHFYSECKNYTKKQLQLVSVEAWFFPLIILLIGISTITTIYIGGLESFEGKITTGNIAEFIIYVNMLTWPVASVGWVTSLVQRAEASMERINEFLETKSEIINPTTEKTDISGDIQFENISFTYPDTGIQALKNISFRLKENETLGIFGKTGSGKSTIANLMCRLYDSSEGTITFGEKNIKKLNLSDLRQNIGYVPQDGFLFSGTVNENISFGKDKFIEEEIKQAARIAEIEDEIENFPKKYETIIGERGVQLSGGQRQRISIARAIFINPPIFIFDDSLSAIDANKEQKILKNLKNKTENNTNIIISHRTSSLKNTQQGQTSPLLFMYTRCHGCSQRKLFFIFSLYSESVGIKSV